MIALREFVRGSFAVGVLLVGLQVIGTILAVAVDTDDLFFLVLGMAVALAVCAGVLWLAAYAAGYTLTPIASGWLGIAVGRHPYGYGADNGNFNAAIGNLLLILVFAAWGYRIWAKAELAGDPFWAIAGLFVGAGGVVVGGLALVPRIYFAMHPGTAEPWQDKSGMSVEKRGGLAPLHEQAAQLVGVLLLCIMLGMGFARCTAASVAEPTDESGRIVLPYGDWVFHCVETNPKRPDCIDPVRFTIVPRGDRQRRIRLTLMPGCLSVQVLDEAGAVVEPIGAAEREQLGIPKNGRGGLEHDYLIFDSRPRQQYTIEIGSGRKESCLAGLRYGVEPTWVEGQGQL